MSIRVEKADNYFKQGFNCSQSVLAAFSDLLKIDENDLLRLSEGFGGGMGKLQKTCGAVSGAFMVISGIYGYTSDKEPKAHDQVYKLVKEFSNRFKEINKNTGCMELIECDLSTPEGVQKFMKNNVFHTQCLNFTLDAVKILETMLDEKQY